MAQGGRIKAFLCTWAHFMKDDVGELRDYDFAPDVRVQRFVCTGNIDPVMVVQAFIDGFDAVFVGTCEPETCRFTGDKSFMAGNKQASAKLDSLRVALMVVGLGAERLKIEWLSPKRPEKFLKAIDNLRAELAAFGPVRKDDETKAKLEVMRDVLEGFRVRWLLGKKLELTTDKNAFGEKIEGDKMHSTIDDALRKEYVRAWLMRVLGKGPATVDEMAKATGFPSDLVLRHLMRLRQRGQVAFCGERHHAPVYCKEGGQ